jgi:hypothetical protein
MRERSCSWTIQRCPISRVMLPLVSGSACRPVFEQVERSACRAAGEALSRAAASIRADGYELAGVGV